MFKIAPLIFFYVILGLKHSTSFNILHSKTCQNFKLGRRRRENVGFIIAHCTNECVQPIPLRFLETILSHVEILFGAICHGKRDRIYYLLHSIIAGLGILPRWERLQKDLFE